MERCFNKKVQTFEPNEKIESLSKEIEDLSKKIKDKKENQMEFYS